MDKKKFLSSKLKTCKSNCTEETESLSNDDYFWEDSNISRKAYQVNLNYLRPFAEFEEEESENEKKNNNKHRERFKINRKKEPPSGIRNSKRIVISGPTICLSFCRYNVVPSIVKSLGWKIVGEKHLWNVLWADTLNCLEICKDMKRFQKINHFPGMLEICRKDLLARNLNRMIKIFPLDYDVFPRTWCFPADLGDAVYFSRENKNVTFILKPDQGARGRGIWLTKSLKDIKPTDRMICQVYITKPLLIDGYKFDLRVYALLTSIDPLRLFVYNEGLTRFATNKYHEPCVYNTNDIYMHLTNYSVNKHSKYFCKDTELGSKRKFSSLNSILLSNGHDPVLLWKKIDDIIIKTIISAWPVLKHNYHACFPSHDVTQACFEILGFDILIDDELNPYILEVNHSPSFHIDGSIDRDVKEGLIHDTLDLLNIASIDKRKILNEDKRRVKKRLLGSILKGEARDYLSETTRKYSIRRIGEKELDEQFKWEDSHLGNFRRIFPSEKELNKYDRFFTVNEQISIYSETLSSKQRGIAAKLLRDSLILEQAKLQPKRNRRKKNSQSIKQCSASNIVNNGNNCSKNNENNNDGNNNNQIILNNNNNKAGLNIFKNEIRKNWSEGNMISDIEEKDRRRMFLEREILVRLNGLHKQIYESFVRHNILSKSDKNKYGSSFVEDM